MPRSSAEPDFVLIPIPPPRPQSRAPSIRIVGPGRKEREYQERIRDLERDVVRADRVLAVAECVERGSARLLDRLERDVERERAEAATLRQAQNRLVLALGSLQRENEDLRRTLADATRAALPPPSAAGGAQRSWLARALHAAAARLERAHARGDA